jgi:hypothetical protein
MNQQLAAIRAALEHPDDDGYRADALAALGELETAQHCQWGSCTAPATHRDKAGILLCPDCVEKAKGYTCGISPIA